ncbi:MAG: UDP-3-O-(3-hydroxymyristoyl)glucosamine N-acyltransferase [Planctomycetota bacterium]|nr:MAG: UDP-3-O-(3-hydroxymyristoyl)glucosamine N-acyltransferase [Planctomycetota bacterium]
MAHTLESLCRILREQGMQPELTGDGATPIESVATLEDAGPRQITFLANPKYEKALQTTRASAVVVRTDQVVPDDRCVIRVADPYAAITVLIVAIHGHRKHRRPAFSQQEAFIAPSARVGENALIYPGVTIDEDVVIGDNAVIYPGCYVGPRCRIGDDLLLYPNVVIYEDAIIGDRVTIHAGAVIGEDGLGYAPVDGKWVKIPQIGIVEIQDDVEIGANCAIDRATLGRTVIGAGTKFSDLIAIGHGTQIGKHCMFVAQVGIAGSVQVGDHVTMAGQAGVVGHIQIGDRAVVGAKAGVINSVPEGETVLGQPAVPITEAKRRVVSVAQIPKLRDAIKRLEREVRELRQQLDDAR